MRFQLLPRYFEKKILKYLIPRNVFVCIIPPVAHTFILFVEYRLYIILVIDGAFEKNIYLIFSLHVNCKRLFNYTNKNYELFRISNELILWFIFVGLPCV